MPLVKANGTAVVNATVSMPLIGVWVADMQLDRTDGNGFPAGTAVTISADGGIKLVGTVVPDRTGDITDSVHVRVIGGKAGMAKPAVPRSFVQPGAKVRDVFAGIANDTGETISALISNDIAEKNLVAWSVFGLPSSESLLALLNVVSPNASWRILSNGDLWVGEETWPDDHHAFEIIQHNPSDGFYLLGVESPSIVPGVTIAGIGRVNRVDHVIESESIRTKVYTDIDGLNRGAESSIAALIRKEIAGIDYFTLYDAKLVSQSGDGATVDLQPLDERLPGYQRVALRHGVPGLKVLVSQGAIIRIGWDRGDPSRPYAALWNSGETITLIEVGSSADKVVTATDIAAIKTAISGAAVAPNDGGATLKANIIAAWPVSVGSNIFKVQR